MFAMQSTLLHAELGRFLVAFQAVEASLVDLIVYAADSDPEYIEALTAELDFNCKARALDVIFTRFAQIHCLTDTSPHPGFHKLMVRVQKLAARRNDIVHFFYHTHISLDGQVGVTRMPTKLKPSDGIREQAHEDILPGQLNAEIADIQTILSELESYRLKIIALNNPVDE
jgi:hypothetical protein